MAATRHQIDSAKLVQLPFDECTTDEPDQKTTISEVQLASLPSDTRLALSNVPPKKNLDHDYGLV